MTSEKCFFEYISDIFKVLQQQRNALAVADTG